MTRPLSARDALLVVRLKRHGIVNPLWTLQAARKAGLPLDVACALLEQETGGGHNVFGHDPTHHIGGPVTKAKYFDYKRRRGPRGAGGMQGVGPMQLTWWEFQDEADRRGGCWNPEVNMRVGFELAAERIRKLGLMKGIAAYNGSGPAAAMYAESVRAKARHWAQVVHAPALKPQTIAATHFTWAEARSHDGVAVPKRLRPNAIRHARNLEKVRKAVNQARNKRGLKPTGITILSWYRSPFQNHKVKGAKDSRHLHADASDIALEEIKRLCPWIGGKDVFEAICNHVFKEGGFGQYVGGDRHVDSRGWRSRWTTWRPG